jgi:hypothetical protein
LHSIDPSLVLGDESKPVMTEYQARMALGNQFPVHMAGVVLAMAAAVFCISLNEPATVTDSDGVGSQGSMTELEQESELEPPPAKVARRADIADVRPPLFCATNPMQVQNPHFGTHSIEIGDAHFPEEFENLINAHDMSDTEGANDSGSASASGS